MDNPEFPRVSKELVERLEELFPDRCPTVKDSDRTIWINVGRADVVRFLRMKYEEDVGDVLR